jgi:hypothetical protein
MANISNIDATRWDVFFEGLPDWVIPLVKITPKFYTDDIYQDSWNDLTLTYDFNYLWEKIDENNYKLHLRLAGELKNPSNEVLPLYADLSLWIVNINYRHGVQHNLGY